jgi:hypothetical protein
MLTEIATTQCNRRSKKRSGSSSVSPRFIALATRDPESSPLQRLQIIKGWIDAADKAHYQVFEIAGDAESAGSIDLATGDWRGPGHSSLCAVFEDPAFDASQPSYFYLRAVEVPSLRWSSRQCADLAVNERPPECENDAPKMMQELAWTSPIWYRPEAHER